MSTTRRCFRCASCLLISEIHFSLSEPNPVILCPDGHGPMTRYFGDQTGLHINVGFQPNHYSNDVDRRIAEYQFSHLS